RRRRFLRATSVLVLVCFITSLASPLLEAAASKSGAWVRVRRGRYVTLNAPARSLQQIQGVGPRTARAIARTRPGAGYRNVNELRRVQEVGALRLKNIQAAAAQRAATEARTRARVRAANLARWNAAKKAARVLPSREQVKASATAPAARQAAAAR